MKRNNKFKVTKIIAATAVSTAILAPNIPVLAVPVKKTDNIIQKGKKELGNIVGINVGNVEVQKTVINGTTNNLNYIPENVVPKTGDIGAIGTSFQYSVPVEFSSKDGKLYNLENSSITVQLNPTGINKAKLTEAQEEAIKILENNIKVEIPKYSHQWNTSGSYVFTTLISLNNSINGIQLNPVMTIHYSIDGKNIEKDISLGKILLTRKYTATINPILKINNNSLFLNVQYLKDNGAVAKYDINNLGYINGNYNIKSLTFGLNIPKGINLIPIKNSDLIINNNGTYTIKGNLLEEVIKGSVNLFNIKYDDIPVLNNIEINLNRESNNVTFNNGEKTELGTTADYESGAVEIKYIPNGHGTEKLDKFNLQSKDEGIVLGEGNMTNAIKTRFSAKIDSEGGNGIAYVGSVITNGEAIITQNNKNIASSNMTYVELPQDIINKLTKGTVKEKAEIMEDIINNKYPWYKKGINSVKEGFAPNFIYTISNVKQNESKVINGEYIKIPKNFNGWSIYPSSTSSTIVGLIYNKDDINKNTISAFSNSDCDGIEKIDGMNSLIGIVSPPKNLFQKVINETEPWNYPQSTYFRDGEFSHGISASSILTWAVSDTMFDKFDGKITAYNERGHGISSNDITQYKEANWLSQPHTINGAMGVNLATEKSIYPENSYIKVNFGGSAIVTGNVLLNGKVISNADLQIKNNYIIIKIPKNTLSNLIRVTVPVQYTDMNLNSITTSLSPCNRQGIEQREIYPISKVNGKMSAWGMIGYADNTAFTNTINFVHNTANVCQQYSNGISKTNTTTITNVVNNLGGEKTTYTIAGRIPSSENNTLPASLGDLTIGGLGSTLEGLETNGADTWVLPNSMLNNPENKDILDNPYPNTLKDLTVDKLKKLGWVKYTSGMSLENIGAYLVKATVNPGQSYTMHYKIRLSNINNKEFQATNAQYKYYDNVNSVGSTSPVITLTPNGSDENTDWMSSVVVQTYTKDNKGKTIIQSTSEMPNNILNEKLSDANNNIDNDPELKDLISNGQDTEEDINLKTPKKLMNIINFAINNKKAFAKLGYKLDYISINGTSIAPGSDGQYSMNRDNLLNWLNNIGISENTTLTKVKFVMSPLKSVPVTVEVKVLNSNGEVINNQSTIAKHTVFNGIVGSYLNNEACSIAIPKGYKLINETVNGKKITPNAEGNTLPEILGQSGENIIYYITKESTNIDLKVEYPNGTIVNNGEIKSSGIPNENTGMNLNEEKISLDGKEIVIPKGYEVAETKVINKNTGQTVSTTMDKVNIVKDYRNYNIQIVVKLKEIPKYKVTGEVVTTDGKVIETLPVTENYAGENFNKTPKIPKGYHLVKTIINGKEITVEKDGSVSGKYSNETENIIWIIEKDPTSTITTEVVDSTGKVLVEKETTIGIVGSKDTSVVPKIPKGYRIEKITDGTFTKDGDIVSGSTEVNKLPDSYTKKSQVIIWHVVKIETTVDIKVINKDTGKVVDQTKPENIKTGSDLRNVKLPNIPEHYHIVSIETNGVINNLGKVIGTANVNPNEIIINIEENPKYKVTGEVITESGKVIETLPVTENYEGEDFTKSPKIPEGYHLIKTIVNNKEVTAGKDGIISGKYSNIDENIIWTIEKNSTNTIVPAETDKGKDINKNTNNNDINKNKDTNSNETNKNKDIISKNDIGNSKIENSSNSKAESNKNISKIEEKNNETKSEQKINQNEQKNNKEVNNRDKVKNENSQNIEKQNSKENPQTGDTTELPIIIAIIVALLALIGINRKRK